ncbi:MAG: DUF5317 domain-containing protein [Chloroflexi bacterium]|nr:DUF5317 domain-containing protein [Chloroflexota bacterium]
MAGFLAALLRAGYYREPLQPPALTTVWLVVIAFLPQWLAFHLAATARLIPDVAAAALLVLTQVLLLIFVWRNRGHLGVRLMGIGVAMNLAVIVANGGLMPTFPEVVAQLAPGATGTWNVGERLWLSKDVVLPASEAALPWLADRFLLPDWLPWRVAFSLGDVFMAGGAFALLWSMSSKRQTFYNTVGERARATP